jgi:hypothetical protein
MSHHVTSDSQVSSLFLSYSPDCFFYGLPDTGDDEEKELMLDFFLLLQKIVTINPCLWNGVKRPCYLFARKFYPESINNLMNLFSNYTLF